MYNCIVDLTLINIVLESNRHVTLNLFIKSIPTDTLK